jgi:GSCFA family
MANTSLSATTPVQNQPKLALLGASACLNLARHLADASAVVLDAETPPGTTSPALAASYGYRQLSARTGEVGSLKALVQILRAAVTDSLPAHWIWAGPKGGVVDGLRSRVDPDGVSDAAELMFLRRAHHVALQEVLRTADAVIVLLSGAPCFVDAKDGATYAFLPERDQKLPKACKLEPHAADLASLDRDFKELRGLIMGINPRLEIRLALTPVPVDPEQGKNDFAASLPQLRQQSDLRVMMAHWQATSPNVRYLPLWELCTGQLAQSGQYAPQTGILTAEGGARVALACMGQEPGSAEPPPRLAATRPRETQQDRKARRALKRANRADPESSKSVICEEELLEAFSK